MPVRVRYVGGIFEPLDEAADLEEGRVYRALTRSDVIELLETLSSLELSERSFAFWDNPEDDVYDEL